MGLHGERSSNSFFHVEERSSKNERKRERTNENSWNPDQTQHSAASDLDLHCLPITLLGSPD